MLRTSLLVAATAASLSAQDPAEASSALDATKRARAAPRSPERTAADVELPPGYRLEVVASEPMIREPAAIAWDGNGRMYVAEMRTYMQDIDGTGELEPKSRISRLEDTDGDGRMDRYSVFVDGLVLPRMILPLQDGLIVRETGTLDLHHYRDEDGDGVADRKELVYAGGPRGGNLEHQPSGLDWNVDNYLYVTYTNKRYRFRDGRITAHPLPAGEGQWGMTHDDWGQCYYSRAGGEIVATQFQQNMQYGKLSLPGELAPGFHECWPIDDVPDVQGGPRRVRADGSLNHFTGCCGQSVFRGDRLPEELRGNLFVPEPVGRLIRRAVVTMDRGTRVLTNPHPGSEFLRTRDANFRPVNSYTGPDGTLYIVDMYRGIIQEGNWVREESYLRGVVQEYGLDEHTGRGRIYRLVHEDFEPGPKPRMLDESSAELVAHLSHPNGWWRDNAQKLLVVRGDRSVAPALRALLRQGTLPQARMHALWTLEGLDVMGPADVLQALADPDGRVRASAVRAAERFLAGDAVEPAVLAEVVALGDDDDLGVALQVLRTALYTSFEGHGEVVERSAARHADKPAFEKTAQVHFERVAAAEAEAARRAAVRRANRRLADAVERGSVHYRTLCFACHGEDGRGAEVPGLEGTRLAPSLVGSARALGPIDRAGRIVLHGLTGPVEGETYPGAMAGMSAFDDAWVADVLTFVRNSWGNAAPLVEPARIAAIREAEADRVAPWTLDELRAFAPLLGERTGWKLASNRNADALPLAVDGRPETRWTSGRPQRPGTWVTVELPEAVEVHGVGLETSRSPNDFPDRFEIRTSLDGVRWSDPVASGKGTRDPIVRFGPVTTRFVKVVQTGRKDGLYWSIHELSLYGPGNPLPE